MLGFKVRLIIRVRRSIKSLRSIVYRCTLREIKQTNPEQASQGSEYPAYQKTMRMDEFECENVLLQTLHTCHGKTLY